MAIFINGKEVKDGENSDQIAIGNIVGGDLIQVKNGRLAAEAEQDGDDD